VKKLLREIVRSLAKRQFRPPRKSLIRHDSRVLQKTTLESLNHTIHREAIVKVYWLHGRQSSTIRFGGYDCVSGFVVIAESEEQARSLVGKYTTSSVDDHETGCFDDADGRHVFSLATKSMHPK
jgi:hypothetical protein